MKLGQIFFYCAVFVIPLGIVQSEEIILPPKASEIVKKLQGLETEYRRKFESGVEGVREQAIAHLEKLKTEEAKAGRLKRALRIEEEITAIKNRPVHGIQLDMNVEAIGAGIELNGYYHKLNPRRMSWDRAREWALEQGGDLAIIENHEDFEKLVHQLKLADVYLGAEWDNQAKRWKWLSGEFVESSVVGREVVSKVATYKRAALYIHKTAKFETEQKDIEKMSLVYWKL